MVRRTQRFMGEAPPANQNSNIQNWSRQRTLWSLEQG